MVVSKLGTFVARFIASIMFSVGTVLLIFYEDSTDCIFWALQMMGKFDSIELIKPGQIQYDGSHFS